MLCEIQSSAILLLKDNYTDSEKSASAGDFLGPLYVEGPGVGGYLFFGADFQRISENRRGFHKKSGAFVSKRRLALVARIFPSFYTS